MYTPRIYNTPDLLRKNNSVLILGPRGSGKSMYVNEIIKEFERPLVIDLLLPRTYQRYLNNPELLVAEVKEHSRNIEESVVFIDEIQLVPSLLNTVHYIIEKLRTSCRFVLTGSSARKLRKTGANLLAGRAIYCPFFTFDYREIPFGDRVDSLLQYGLLPRSVLEGDKEQRSEYLRTYCHVYLKEEILQEAIVRNIEAFSQFLELAAFEDGRLLNFEKIGQQVGVTGKTIKEYFQILDDTLIAFRLPAWTNSIRKQLQKSPKYYLFDTGVINTLTGDIDGELKHASYRYGRLFENLVVNEIRKKSCKSNLNLKMSHYRTNHGQEIDLILRKTLRSPPVAVEIKSGDKPGSRDVVALKAFGEEFTGARLYVICQTPNPYNIDEVSVLGFPEGLDRLFEEF